uniref:Uncharacterized protein n=1 Tax=Siphoviridae sp. ct8wU2 TaxID=2827791 RepID=A0A8S5SXF3_9CAUD|nr:MAG TPA: hypothetical protein [Siphoviridae sp. ct8wU2]DAV94976.1 MAG TPA: hypothetical protein [Caudoviricetes sp.]
MQPAIDLPLKSSRLIKNIDIKQLFGQSEQLLFC